MMRRPIVTPLMLCLALGACEDDKAPKGDSAASAEPAPASTGRASRAAKTAKGTTRGKRPRASKKSDIPAPDDVDAPPEDAEKTDSGLATQVLEEGEGDTHPEEGDSVKVHYTGWTTDGEMFDSSVKKGKPAKFGVTQVIDGWTEGLQLMVAGEKRRMWIPSDLAYGDNPKRRGAPAGDLVFDVELLEIVPGPKTPENLTPPDDADETDSGLAYKELEKGEGKASPGPKDVVKVQYSGWTTDGEMFDSSVTRGRPAQFPVGKVIDGWTEGLQLMTKGDKFRFWIPAELAYGEKPKKKGAPAGDLVFDVELLDVRSRR